MLNLTLILTGVSLNAFAQIFLKKGMIDIGHFAFSLANVLPIGLKVVFNPFILSGLTCHAVSVIVWLLVLSRVEVSFAYSFLSVGYVITAVIGYLAFGENLSAFRISGIALVCFGVMLISRS